jgi:hypothetical protein
VKWIIYPYSVDLFNEISTLYWSYIVREIHGEMDYMCF